MGIAFAPAVAGRFDAHQARIHGVLHIAFENTVLDQHIALAGVALVVHIERAPAVRQGAVIQHGDPFCRHALTDATGKCAGPLAVEVALQAVANGFMQQNTGPAGAEHHGHFTGRRRTRLQIGQRGFHRLIHVLRNDGFVKIGQAETPAATGRPDFAPALLFGDDGHTQPHERAHIGRQRAIGARHHHHIVFTGQPGHDLRHARIFGPGQLFHFLQQLDLGRAVERGNRVQSLVQGARRGYLFSRRLGPRRRGGG